MKKFYLIFPIVVWVSLFCIDLSSILFQKSKPMYFRAWEYVINEGKDSYYVPFKPLSYYNGPVQGDLLKMASFWPKKESLTSQIFHVDEYGFRNRENLLKKPITAVVVGTSFVGGTHETQKDLIPDILIDKYHISAYNYATLPLQHFWEDKRFISHEPKYVVVVANEAEVLQNTWVEVLAESTTTHAVPAWKNVDAWEKINTADMTYDFVVKYLSRFSLVKYELNQAYLYGLNRLLPRSIVAFGVANGIAYDPKTDFLFFDVVRYDPRYNAAGKLALQQTIETLKKTRDILKQRQITLIVASVPTKASLYYSDYRDMPQKDKTLYYFEKEMDENGIANVKLLNAMTKYAHTKDHLVYYRDDTHWTTDVNYYIADKVQKIIHGSQ